MHGLSRVTKRARPGHGVAARSRIRPAPSRADKRALLRQTRALRFDDLHRIRRHLADLDERSTRGPWTTAIMRVIAVCPGRRAADLADRLGRTKAPLQANIRRLRDLGLVESLPTGYRLSARGLKVLVALARLP